MPYADQADLLEEISADELVNLTDDAGTGNIDADVVSRAIANADAEIYTYCATQYVVPFSPVLDIVRKLSVDITIYNLYGRRRGATDDRKQRYDNAVNLLRRIADGSVSLGAGAPDPDDDGGPEASQSADDRIFTLGRDSKSTLGSLDNY